MKCSVFIAEIFEYKTKMMIIMKMQVMLNLLLPFFYFRNKNFSNSNCINWIVHAEKKLSSSETLKLIFGENFHLFANTNPPPTVPVSVCILTVSSQWQIFCHNSSLRTTVSTELWKTLPLFLKITNYKLLHLQKQMRWLWWRTWGWSSPTRTERRSWR